jgi:hypothetical protein
LIRTGFKLLYDCHDIEDDNGDGWPLVRHAWCCLAA